MRTRLAAIGAVVLAGSMALAGQQVAAPPAPSAQVFRSSVNLVLVDVVVRDKTGAIVHGLSADDFELLEDGRPQKIQSFAFDEISTTATPIETATMLSASAAPNPVVIGAGDRTSGSASLSPGPMTLEDVAGHRLLVLLFDTSSMEPEDVQGAADSALKWVDARMTAADLVAIASVGSSLQILADFTSDKERLLSALRAFSAADGTAAPSVDSSTAATDEANAVATDDTEIGDASAQELDTFNNDVRLRALTTLANLLMPIQQKKAILYFSSGMARNGSDNQVELRKAVNTAVRANVAIYPVDARGLQAVVPGGSARNGSRGGVGAFSGRAVAQQFDQLASQQETLHTLASDTGGTAFTDTNDFGEAFTKVAKDISAYYILGFSSTNPNQDGRYRRLTVRLRNRPGLKVEAREGYYADRDFAHTAKTDRETLLREQLTAALPATDIPIFVTSGWFRLASDKYYVPVSVAVPGSAIPSSDKTTLDLAGFIRDERGLPVAQIRDTLTVPSKADDLSERQVVYQTGVTLPPGRFTAKIVVRENTTGQMGTFETPVVVPELKRADVKVSSVVIGTQLQKADGRKTASPLVRNQVEIVPNLTRIVNRNQTLYVYYEVYDPAIDNGSPQLGTSLEFYRGSVKAFETPVVSRTRVDAEDRHAAIFQFEVPASSLRPGLYTCQINIVDEVAGHFTFPRVELFVR